MVEGEGGGPGLKVVYAEGAQVEQHSGNQEGRGAEGPPGTREGAAPGDMFKLFLVQASTMPVPLKVGTEIAMRS